MSKHTPGPWFVGGVRQKLDGQQALGIYRFDAEKRRDENIASVWYDLRDGAGTMDARLIAAAPDMLEALKEAQANFKTYDRFKVDVDAMRKIEAAIAKAEGRA